MTSFNPLTSYIPASISAGPECETAESRAPGLEVGEFEAVVPPLSVPAPLPTGSGVGTELLLDTATIRDSDAPNRDAAGYGDAAFAQLKANILQIGGNVSAIKVRRVRARCRAKSPVRYEVVYGHRRLRACRELGFQVLAIVHDDLDDRQALLERVSENTGRADFTPLELGRICVHALKEEHFATQKLLAVALGRDTSDISKAITLAGLPPTVIAAFGCPGDLQYRHAKPLRDAISRNVNAVLAAAHELADEDGPKPPRQVLERLTRNATNPIGPSNLVAPVKRAIPLVKRAIPLVWKEATVGALDVSAEGNVTIRISGWCGTEVADTLVREIQEFYGLHLSGRPDREHQQRLWGASSDVQQEFDGRVSDIVIAASPASKCTDHEDSFDIIELRGPSRQ